MSQVNQSVLSAPARTIRFIACGGTGVNVLRAYREGEPVNDTVDRADEKFSYFDTSLANLHDVNRADVYLIKGADGSGSDRAKNAEAILAAIPEFLREHEAEDFNVVIFSACGGTGSVAGPVLMERLAADGHKVVGIEIGGHDTLKHTTNTIGTQIGLQSAIKRLNKPLVTHYYENDPSVSPDINNQGPRYILGALSILASGKNGGLDSSDLGNLFNFSNVTHHQPCLAQLMVFSDEKKLTEYPHRLVTLGALLKDRSQVVPNVYRDHGKVAYLSDSHQRIEQSFYFAVSIQAMSEINDKLSEKKTQAEKLRGVSESTTQLGGDTAEIDSKTGLSFF